MGSRGNRKGLTWRWSRCQKDRNCLLNVKNLFSFSTQLLQRLTPLLLNACWEGYADVAELLINAGADVNETVLESVKPSLLL